MIGADLWSAWQERRAGHQTDNPPGAPPLEAVAATLPDPALIPPREWLYGTRLIRRFVSVLAAPGGVGKSSLALGQALALATGRPILGERVHHSVPAWVLNLEDPLEETQRRLAALMRLHAIPREAVAGRLFLHSGRERRVTMAELDEGAGVQHPDRDAIIAAAQARGIGLIVVDPFVKSHRVDENSNAQIDAAATAWAEVAEATRAAVLLVHHVRKGAASDVEAARGAKALTDAARSASLLAAMTADEAQRLGVAPADRWRMVRLDDAKANLAPRSTGPALWFRLETVALGNATPDYPHGDHVAAIAPWTPAAPAGRGFAGDGAFPGGAFAGRAMPIGATDPGATAYGADFGGADFGGADFGGADLGGAERDGAEPRGEEPGGAVPDGTGRALALLRIAAGPGRGFAWHAQRGGRAADRWVGRAVAEACGVSDARAAALVADWLGEGVLEEWPYRDTVQRKRRIGVRVGAAFRDRPAEPSPSDPPPSDPPPAGPPPAGPPPAHPAEAAPAGLRNTVEDKESA